jgi:hypothetical protein
LVHMTKMPFRIYISIYLGDEGRQSQAVVRMRKLKGLKRTKYLSWVLPIVYV